MKIGKATLAALGLSLPAHAADRTFLSKEEVEALASGRKWDLIRAIDKNQIRPRVLMILRSRALMLSIALVV